MSALDLGLGHPARAPRPLEVAGRWTLAHAADVSVVATVGWWATLLARGTGGREPHLLSIACVLLALSAVAVRPWRVLPTWTVLLAQSIGVAAFAVVLTAPTGSAGLDDAASYAFAAELGLVLLAWAVTHERRTLLVAAALAAGVYQFAVGWLAWWGNGDQTKLFQGTYYWHNQAGIALAAGALAGAVLVARGGRDPLRLLGWALAPLCVAGTMFTGSRGSQIGLLLGLAVLALAGLCRRGWRAGGLRVLALAGLAWAVTYVLSGPPFFAQRASVTAAIDGRGDTFVGNGVQRVEDWRRAWDIFQHWPVTGAGFNSFDGATTLASERRDGAVTAFAHNGFLQLLSDGGLVLAVPCLVVVGVVGLAALRAVPASVRAGDWVQPGAAVVLLVLLLHSGMDFDWTYPTLLSTVAVVGVAALPVARSTAAVAQVAPDRRREWLLGAVVVGLLVAGAVVGWGGGISLNAPIG